MNTLRDNLFSEAKGNIKVSQTKQKRDYDKKHAQKKVIIAIIICNVHKLVHMTKNNAIFYV